MMRLSERVTRRGRRMNLEFIWHARNYLAGDVLAGLIVLVSISVLTRLLSPGEYGTLAIFVSVMTIFALMLELNFRGAVSRYWLEDADDFPDFLATNMAFLVVITGINLAWLWLARAPIARFFRLSPDLFYLAVLCAAMRLPWNLNWKLLVAQKRSVRYAGLKVLREGFLYGLGVSWVYLLSSERHLGMVYTYLLVSAGLAAWLSIWLVKQTPGGRLRWKHLRYALWFGIPLMPHALSGFVLNFFDRVIVAQIEGESSAGLYSLAYDVGSVMNVVVGAMGQSWLPLFVEWRRTGHLQTIERQAALYAKCIYVIALGLVLFSPEIMTLLADRAFHQALPVVPFVIYGCVFVFLYTLYSNYSFYLHRTGWITVATLVAGSVNVGLNYWAVPRWGYAAAAWTTLVSYGLLFLLHFLIARLILGELVIRLRAVLPWLLVSAALSAACTVAQASISIENGWVMLFALKLPLVALVLWLVVRMRGRDARRGNAADD